MMAADTSLAARRNGTRERVAFDIVLATALFAATVVAIHRHESGRVIGLPGPGWDAIRYVAATMSSGALVFRRWWPALVLAVVAPSVAILIALGEHGPGQITIAFAVFSAASTSARRLAPATVVLIVAMVLAGALAAPGGPEWAPLIAGPACVLVGWLAGENTRNRQAVARDLVERARAREHEHEERARRAAVDERLRIARDLHDIVAHSMSVIAVRSGAARMVADTDPDEVRASLAIIERTSRETLRELRRIVGVLRRADDGTSALEPAPRLADVPDLVRGIDATGTHVELHIEGDERELSEGLELSAYRIAQEALTNVVRHAGRTRARLWVRYLPDKIEIEVVDDGATNGTLIAPTDGVGHGLVGMRERVALYNGELEAGPKNGGYRVLVRLPTDEDR